MIFLFYIFICSFTYNTCNHYSGGPDRDLELDEDEYRLEYDEHSIESTSHSAQPTSSGPSEYNLHQNPDYNHHQSDGVILSSNNPYYD